MALGPSRLFLIIRVKRNIVILYARRGGSFHVNLVAMRDGKARDEVTLRRSVSTPLCFQNKGLEINESSQMQLVEFVEATFKMKLGMENIQSTGIKIVKEKWSPIGWPKAYSETISVAVER